MTIVQMYLTIGIPSLLIVLSWINNNSRFERIERRLDEHDRRFLEMDKRFSDVKDSGHKDALEIMRQMTALHERVAKVEANQAR